VHDQQELAKPRLAQIVAEQIDVPGAQVAIVGLPAERTTRNRPPEPRAPLANGGTGVEKPVQAQPPEAARGAC
jgi:hypothetical protein